MCHATVLNYSRALRVKWSNLAWWVNSSTEMLRVSIHINERHFTQRHSIIAQWQQTTAHCRHLHSVTQTIHGSLPTPARRDTNNPRLIADTCTTWHKQSTPHCRHLHNMTQTMYWDISKMTCYVLRGIVKPNSLDLTMLQHRQEYLRRQPTGCTDTRLISRQRERHASQQRERMLPWLEPVTLIQSPWVIQTSWPSPRHQPLPHETGRLLELPGTAAAQSRLQPASQQPDNPQLRGRNCYDKKIHVKNLGYRFTNNPGPKNHRFSTTLQNLTATLTANIFGVRHDTHNWDEH